MIAAANHWHAWGAVVSLFCGACTDSGSSGAVNDPAAEMGAGGETGPGVQPVAQQESEAGTMNPEAAGPNVLAGVFLVELVAAVEESQSSSASPAFASVFGRVSDGPTPSPLKWELVAQDGDCKLLKPSTPFCDPTCGSEALCVADGECNAFPTPLDVGEVTIRGVSLQSGENQLVMTALPPSNNYQPIGKQLLYPPFDEGEEVVLESSGEGIAALNLRAFGVKPLVLSGEDPILLEPDTPLEISWVAAADSDASVIQATFDISHHGGQKGELVCETADDGTLTIAASLVTGLIDLGYSGFPSVHVIRKSVATQQTRVGKVQLVLQSTEERSLALPGLISCVEIDSPEGCPDGQTCKQDLKCAE